MSKQANRFSRTAFWLLALFFAGMMVQSLYEHTPSWTCTGDRQWVHGVLKVCAVLAPLWLLFNLATLSRRELLSAMAFLVPFVLAESVIFAAILLMERLHVRGLAFDVIAPTVCWAACILFLRLHDWLEAKVAEMYPSQTSHNLPTEAKREASE